MSEGSQDIKKSVPGWLAFMLSISVPLALGLVGYGALGARVSSAEKQLDETKARIEKVEARADERDRDTYKAINDMRVSLGGVQLDVARILAILKR